MNMVAEMQTLWHGLFWPLCRLTLFISLGLVVGNFLEALNWTRGMAKIATPLIRLGRFSETAGASFSMALLSGVAANTMLAEAYEQGRLQKKELVLANLFNNLPTYFLHLPTVFFITAPLLKGVAVVYVGLTFAAALFRTLVILLVGRLMLTADKHGPVAGRFGGPEEKGVRHAVQKTWERFQGRIKKILCYTLPIYTVIYFFNRFGLFTLLEGWLESHLSVLAWLRPQSVGIVVFHVAAEFTAGLAAAGALLDGGSLGERDVVLALLTGNVLSSPVRAVRHQLPYYAGIFQPRLAGELVLCSQLFRAGSIVGVMLCYYFLTR